MHLICDRCKRLKKIQRHHIGRDGLYFVWVGKIVSYKDYLEGFEKASKLCARCHKYISVVNKGFREAFWEKTRISKTPEGFEILASLQTSIYQIFVNNQVLPKKPILFVDMCVMELLGVKKCQKA